MGGVCGFFVFGKLLGSPISGIGIGSIGACGVVLTNKQGESQFADAVRGAGRETLVLTRGAQRINRENKISDKASRLFKKTCDHVTRLNTEHRVTETIFSTCAKVTRKIKNVNQEKKYTDKLGRGLSKLLDKANKAIDD